MKRQHRYALLNYPLMMLLIALVIVSSSLFFSMVLIAWVLFIKPGYDLYDEDNYQGEADKKCKISKGQSLNVF